MAFQKGTSGNPGGRPKELVWRDAIHRAVKRVVGGGDIKQLDLLADKLVTSALDGDFHALREIGDRLDGRPAQAIAVESDAPPAIQKIVVCFADDELEKAITIP